MKIVVSDAKAERSLLASVVLAALADACSPPPKSDKSKRAVMKSPIAGFKIARDAFTAMRFLFDKQLSGLDAYAAWLDFETDHFRLKLLKVMSDNSPHVIQGFEPMQRKNFRFNYGLWLQTKGEVGELDDIDDDEDE